MTIRQKLFLLAFISIVGLLGVYGINLWGAKQLGELNDLEAAAGKIKISILNIQVAQRDFYLGKKPDDAQRAAGAIYSLIGQVNALGGMRPELSQVSRQVVDELRRYDAIFSEIVSGMEMLGLDENSGLEGSLRRSVREAEQLINERKDDGLRGDMLMLRRREKDFMLRGGLNYLESFNKDMATILARIQASTAHEESLKTRMRQLLTNYQDEFTQYVQTAQRVAESRQAHGAIASELTPHLDSIVKTTHDIFEQMEGRNQNISAMLTLAFVLAVLGGSVAVAFSIIRSLAKLRRFAAFVAGGDFQQAQAFISEKGDIGELMASMRQIPAVLQSIMESIYIKIDLLYTSPQQGGEPWQSVKIAAQNMR